MPAKSETEILKFFPKVSDPICDTESTSPITYPVPPLFTVAAMATPSEIVMSAVAFSPLPVTFVNGTL